MRSKSPTQQSQINLHYFDIYCLNINRYIPLTIRDTNRHTVTTSNVAKPQMSQDFFHKLRKNHKICYLFQVIRVDFNVVVKQCYSKRANIEISPFDKTQKAKRIR